MVIWLIEAMMKIKKMCEENNIFLIFDEVMTGFGRTGKMFAFEHAEIVPDLLCLSKGLTGGALPMSLTLATFEIYQAFLSKDVTKMFFHGHSFTANPIACAAAVANIKKFKKEKIVDKILSIESTHRECLDRISLPFIKDKRSKGVVGVLELEEGGSSYGSHCSNKITASILEKGIFLRPLGNVIYMMPPYCSTLNEISQGWGLVKEVLEELY